MRQARWVSIAPWAALWALCGGCDGGGGTPAEDAAIAVDAVVDQAVDMQVEVDAAPCTEGETRICDRAPACRGVATCVDGVFGPCEAKPEACNGLDDDCDDATDEGFEGLGAACVAGVGACAVDGVVACAADGASAVCDAVAGPAGDEVCNGLDDDCDGDSDEGFGLAEECVVGEGACAAVGLVVCGDDGAATCGATPGEPTGEACNGVDDDCDGSVDEGLGLGEPCAAGVGACASEGVVVCGLDEAPECDAVPGAPGVEACDGVDDDCDGAVDEGFGVGEPCVDGEGVCAETGRIVCVDGGARCEAQVAEPGVESCNGLDDDCDGRTDEDYRVGRGCAVGIGACAAVGVTVCAGEDDVTCDAVVGEPTDELCDGVDDDCDGRTDEGFDLGAPCRVGQGACEADGVRACADDGGWLCAGEPGEPRDELCDGADDDCDGVVDEDFGVGEGCVVGVGACAGAGVVACDVDGAAVCDGAPGAPGDELCNDVDDDCDGIVDEGFGRGRACLVDVAGCGTVGVSGCRGGEPVCDAVNRPSQTGNGVDGEWVVGAGEVLYLEAPLYALTRLHVQPGGVVAVAPFDPETGVGGRVDLRVSGEVIIEPGAVIDVAGIGWPGGSSSVVEARDYPGSWSNQGGSTGWHGTGPGAGQGGFAAPQAVVGSGGGGGHVSAGEDGTACGVDARDLAVWDVNTAAPVPIAAPPPGFSTGGRDNGDGSWVLALGSGGGGGANNYDGGPDGVGGRGGGGGGALRISAASIVVDGDIIADGESGQDGVGGEFLGGGGGGAGGSVHLVATDIAVGGRVSAEGGAGGVGTNESVGGPGGLGWVRLDGSTALGGRVAGEVRIGASPVCLAEAVFEYAGEAQAFVVPDGVTRLYVEAWGAQGGSSESCVVDEQSQDDGGQGGYVAGVVEVEPGSVLAVRVGGKPELAQGDDALGEGGFNGGGGCGQYGGCGGGATDLRVGGDGLEHRVLVAGGGGGGNTGCPDHGMGGIGGGLIGGDGSSFLDRVPGGGGAQDAGGTAGESDGAFEAAAGAEGLGGDVRAYHFAGGGGGYYGGGSAYAAGGGGGSSFFGGAALGATDAGVRAGHGRMIIRW